MIKFPCGCEFEQNEKGKPIFNPNIAALRLDCPATWDMICDGNTKGVFQLESQLGQGKAKEAKPRNITELSDLGAILRPGCLPLDSRITVKITHRKDDGSRRIVKKTIQEIISKGKPYPEVLSVDTKNRVLVSNKIEAIFPTGNKECFRINIRRYSMGKLEWIKNKPKTIYNLECTKDHEILRHDGEWVELQYLERGDRIAVFKMKRMDNRKFQDTTANRHSPHADILNKSE